MPLTDASWFANRLDAFGTSFCAVLLSVPDPDTAFDRFDMTERNCWFDHRIGWLPLDEVDGRIGPVGPPRTAVAVRTTLVRTKP